MDEILIGSPSSANRDVIVTYFQVLILWHKFSFKFSKEKPDSVPNLLKCVIVLLLYVFLDHGCITNRENNFFDVLILKKIFWRMWMPERWTKFIEGTNWRSHRNHAELTIVNIIYRIYPGFLVSSINAVIMKAKWGKTVTSSKIWAKWTNPHTIITETSIW